MDDDDYYPKMKEFLYSVEMLQSHPKALCAGSSEIYIYFHEMEKIYQHGPYSQRMQQLAHLRLRENFK